ncbi:DUF1488 domain-containing protein [Bradyrhizobium sp. HKCCYLS2038]|uniref:DUF1488 domain-containing protein n=1 Tax=unclassified Bradyrhizobium TaxID=2631580 RepID=UPI003EB6C1B0
MARETIYVVQAFSAGRGGRAKADTPIACKTEASAIRTAERLASSKAGVVAFSSSADPEMGDYDDEPLSPATIAVRRSSDAVEMILGAIPNRLATHMIEFPNHSRSYDRTRRAVRFWGYDSAMEASFFVDEGALKHLQPDTRLDESGFLTTFDSNRDRICAAAAKIYVRGTRGSYDLLATHF